ncbi:MAG TPA: tetratricopeptide repeat protein, partial [Bacteroidia bacterium]|nr:tetratricopeptide repeat protein [Bacteroidia bacterium]
MFKDKKFLVSCLGLFLLVFITYSNHFQNSFHFDDSHSIENNGYIRSLHNIPLFFKSGTTFSTLPSNQTYRPMLSVVYTLAYHLGGGDVFWFHLIIFSFFILLGILIFLLSFKIFEITYPDLGNKYLALFAAGWFMVSTCNSDTVNYISSSSDSLSTFWVMVALCLFVYFPQKRKFFFYLIPLIIAALFKPSAIVFPALLGIYVWLFENKESIQPVENNEGTEKKKMFSLSKMKTVLLLILPSFLLCILLYVLQSKLNSPDWHPSASRYNYLITQPFVALHYLFTFYFPTGLSVDPDWTMLNTIFDIYFIIGIAFLVVLWRLIMYCLKRPNYYPIVFGLVWYIIALLPSSLIPLEEVMNDHRSFFSNIGLVIASTWILKLILEYFKKNYKVLKIPFELFMVLILLLNSIGTFERNKVWKSEKTLWYDVTIKSPNNGRGLMNYGNILMAEGKYDEAEIYYQQAFKLLPYYSYLFDNMAILKAAKNQPDSAEIYFKKAVALRPDEPAVYFFYARFLHQQNNDKAAIDLLKQSLIISPSDVDSRYLLMKIYLDDEDWQNLSNVAKETLALFPGDNTAKTYLESSILKKSKIGEAIENIKLHPTSDNYVNLSLLYFNRKNYDSCISTSRHALKIDSTNILAYNNMGSAYNALKQWGKAETAFTHALEINPKFQLAINNLKWSIGQKN